MYNVSSLFQEIDIQISKSEQKKIIFYLLDKKLLDVIRYKESKKPLDIECVDITSEGKIYVEQLQNKSIMDILKKYYWVLILLFALGIIKVITVSFTCIYIALSYYALRLQF
jgi:hypothetical protein